jgi:hypothetical protein
MSDVDNLTFVRIVDKQVRDAMQKVEVKLLPDAKRALEYTGIPLQQHPVEGYYGKSQELTEYFNIIRSLQLNFSNKINDSVEKLHGFYSSNAFGIGQTVRTAINSEGVWYPDEKPAVISPRVDPLTVAVTKAAKSPATVHNDLTIENVTRILEDVEIGECLVGLGSLADKIERRRTHDYNPVATTLTRETTVLSAYVPTLRGLPQYKVSSEVEKQGNVVINAYNELFEIFGFKERIENVTEESAFRLNHDLPEMNRCVRIFNLELPTEKPEFYHWAIGREDYKPKVVDFWRNEIVTTDMFEEKPERYLKKRAR